jgi:hypothetical protein
VAEEIRKVLQQGAPDLFLNTYGLVRAEPPNFCGSYVIRNETGSFEQNTETYVQVLLLLLYFILAVYVCVTSGGPLLFQKSGSPLQILVARTETRSKPNAVIILVIVGATVQNLEKPRLQYRSFLR